MGKNSRKFRLPDKAPHDARLRFYQVIAPWARAAETNGSRCGECTECCEYEQVIELRKAPDTPCPHCAGGGCKIYEDRPLECKVFYCGWRMFGLPKKDRPDRSGVYASFSTHPTLKTPEDLAIGAFSICPGVHGLIVCRPGSRSSEAYNAAVAALLPVFGIVKTEARSGKLQALHLWKDGKVARITRATFKKLGFRI